MTLGPTFAEMRDPALMPPGTRERALAALARPLDPLNLWNLSWKADGAVPFTVAGDAAEAAAARRGGRRPDRI